MYGVHAVDRGSRKLGQLATNMARGNLGLAFIERVALGDTVPALRCK